jgi:hypothetical protein
MLDKTKHEKIFVLNDSKSAKAKPDFSYDKILEKLKGSIINNSPSQIRKILEDILPDYKPSNQFKTNSTRSKIEVEA